MMNKGKYVKINVNTKSEFSEFLEKNGTGFFVFSTKTCTGCVQQKEILKKLWSGNDVDCDCYELTLDQASDLLGFISKAYRIMAFPGMVLMNGGSVVSTFIGLTDEKKLIAALNNLN